MSSVVSFAMYFDAIVTLVKVGEMEKAFAVPSVTDRPATATSFGSRFLGAPRFRRFWRKEEGRGKRGNAPSGPQLSQLRGMPEKCSPCLAPPPFVVCHCSP